MYLYGFIADGWRKDEMFYCRAYDILIACDMFESFCERNNIKYHNVKVDIFFDENMEIIQSE